MKRRKARLATQRKRDLRLVLLLEEREEIRKESPKNEG